MRLPATVKGRKPQSARFRFVLGVPALLALLAAAGGPRAAAHEGPPFPLFVDRPAGSYLVSLWADPDIGEAEFFVIVDSPGGRSPATQPSVVLWVEPVDARLPRTEYRAARQPLRSQVQYLARPHFDRRDLWTVGVLVAEPGRPPSELTTEVESTPPGYGRWDLLIYLFPFALLGGMWVIAIIRHRRMARQPASTAS